MVKDTLFSSYRLNDHFKEIKLSLFEYIEIISENQIFETEVDTLVEHCVGKFEIEPLELYEDRSKASHIESQKTVHGGYGYRSGASFTVKTLAITHTIPFTGDEVLWRLQPSSFKTRVPVGTVIPASASEVGSLSIVINLPTDEGADEFQKEYERNLENIKGYLASQARDIEAFNADLKVQTLDKINMRKEELNKHRAILEALNIPLEPNPDAPSFELIPIKKVVVPLPEITPPGEKPEPGINKNIYEHILNVIRHEGISWENSPETYSVHDEEGLRDIILSHLNTHFEGKATGETFRKKGKTDIRIEAEDRVAFVAECKVWTGPKAVGEALEQLLGYLTWRDCKASLVFFNKHNLGFSEITEKLPSALKSHDLFETAVIEDPVKAEWRFTFRDPEDAKRKVTIHIFAFNLFVRS